VSPYAHLSHEVEQGPAGPKVGALFDLDGTLIAGFSVLALLRDRLFEGALSLEDVADTALSALAYNRGRMGFSGLLGALARVVRGTRETELEEICNRLFARSLAGLVYPEARALVRAHRLRGHTLAIVSAATRYQVEPIARDLGIEHVLCSALEVESGRFTGSVARAVWGDGKLDAARGFADARGLDLAESYFYSDGGEDLPLLDAVGRPRPLNPDVYLESVARGRGWPVRRFTSRTPARVPDVLRTLAMVGAAPGPALLAASAALLGRAGQPLARLGTELWGRLGSAAAGLRLRVRGEEHLLAARPCVFVFNHQSAIDPLLLCRLMRQPFAWLVASAPGASPALRRLAAPVETIFLDASGRDGGLHGALARLRRGEALVAAHASGGPAPRLERLDRAPLRVAAAARVPLVPIAIHNAQAAMPTNALFVRPASVEIDVLPPIDTDAWSSGELGPRADALHERFSEILQP
jgi:putative phosphoserine phosphatase/1-acylglycerol-3-phosphate O-acyltransferase